MLERLGTSVQRAVHVRFLEFIGQHARNRGGVVPVQRCGPRPFKFQKRGFRFGLFLRAMIHWRDNDSPFRGAGDGLGQRQGDENQRGN
jgi:hypothetical protein